MIRLASVVILALGFSEKVRLKDLAIGFRSGPFLNQVKIFAHRPIALRHIMGMSMICVTHELNFAKRVANRIIFMDEGRIVEEQPPKDFFANPKTDRAKLFLSQILDH